MFLPRSFSIYGALAALLSGCVAPESTWTTRSEIFIERDETAFVPGALDSAIDKIFGSGGGGTLFSQDTSNPDDDEDEDEDLVYTVPQSEMIGARLLAERPMSKRAAWTVSATGSFGRSTYFLPDGAEIPINSEPVTYEDPITVKFQTASVDLAVGAKRLVYDGRWFDIDLSGAAGVLFTLTKTDVRSIIVNDDWAAQELPYVSLAVKLTANRKARASGKGHSQPYLTLGARAYPGVGARFVTQLGMQF